MKNVLALGGSNSSKSINKKFAEFVAQQLEVEVTEMDWSDFTLPLFSPDDLLANGIPENALKFKALIDNSDAVVLSLAEYNAMPSAAFKNLWDWTSKIDVKFWAMKPMFLAAASPGGRGGASVLKIIKELIPHYGGNVICDFSLPKFHENFVDGALINQELKKELEEKIKVFKHSI